MKKLLLILICLFMSFEVKSNDHLKFIKELEDLKWYLYEDRIQRSGNIINFSTLYERESTGTFKSKGITYQFLSYRVNEQMDCLRTKVRPLKIIYYEFKMGKGKIIYETGKEMSNMKWESETPSLFLLDHLCKNY